MQPCNDIGELFDMVFTVLINRYPNCSLYHNATLVYKSGRTERHACNFLLEINGKKYRYTLNSADMKLRYTILEAHVIPFIKGGNPKIYKH